MPATFDPRLLRGLSVYQDVVVEGRTVQAGRRDCAARWRLIESHLPRQGVVLDVGSNFGWFGLQVCAARPDVVVASVEADLRSAAVQRAVLASHAQRPICLLTRPAGPAMLARFAAGGQRFDAALLLSVLHWIAQPERFLAALGSITSRLLVEHPHTDEPGAGCAWIRRRIGPIGPFLGRLFPHRPVVLLGTTASHLDGGYHRQIWLVAPPPGEMPPPADGIDVQAAVAAGIGWPQRDWWLAGLEAACRQIPPDEREGGPARLRLAPAGLSWTGGAVVSHADINRYKRLLHRVPQDRLVRPGDALGRRLIALGGKLLRPWRLLS